MKSPNPAAASPRRAFAIPLHDFRAQYESIRADVAFALADVLERQDYVLGRETVELERQMAELCGVREAAACANGSDALHLALMAMGVTPGDEVLVPAFTFFATAGEVARLGARSVFADIEAETFNISPESAAALARRHPKLKAAIPVDLFGQMPDYDALRQALPAGLPILEDAAQAVLAEYGGRRAGSMGVAGTFSFYPSKNLGAFGDGGMLVTDNADLAARVRRLRNHGAGQGRDRYFHDDVGFNSRLDTLQAAVLLVKLKRLEAWTVARENAAARYTKLFAEAGVPVVTPAVAKGAPRRHVFHQYTIRARNRDALREHMTTNGIGTAIYYPLPLHLQKCFAPLGGKTGDCPEAERAAGEVLSLPLFPEITADQQARVVDTVTAFYRK